MPTIQPTNQETKHKLFLLFFSLVCLSTGALDSIAESSDIWRDQIFVQVPLTHTHLILSCGPYEKIKQVSV